jgi:hypothetical protein
MLRLMAERKRLVISEWNLLDCSEDEVNTPRKVVSRLVLRSVTDPIVTNSLKIVSSEARGYCDQHRPGRSRSRGQHPRRMEDGT